MSTSKPGSTKGKTTSGGRARAEKSAAGRSARGHRVVLVTAPDLDCARALARVVLEARAAACVNLIPRLESHYWWQGKIETSTEVLLVMKTGVGKVAALEALVRGHHPYDTPAFVTLTVASGSQRYLDWIDASTAPV